VTLLCVPIFVESVEQTNRDVALAAEAGADMVELRVDSLTEPLDLPEPMLPYIITCRPVSEGGKSKLADVDRLQLINRMTSQRAAYVDVELETYLQRPDVAHFAQPPRRLIVSSHDFQGRPTRLQNQIVQMSGLAANVHKLVWTARSIRDNIEAFELLQSKLCPTIALCMGEAGLISRVLARKFGAFLTFASLRDESATAPGQVTIDDMKRLYRWDAIRASTKVFGVVASPVKHSMSPAVHNAAFEETGFDGVYLPMLVNPGYESFKAFMESFLHFVPLDLAGLSITLPHKENALKYLLEKNAHVEPLARQIGAINTISIRHTDTGSELTGSNTDYAAILDSITDELGITRNELAGVRVAVIGAGGTGRTAVAALASCGATVVVYNRTKSRADALADEFNGQTGKVVAARLEKLCDSCCHVYINTTSIGMSPNVDMSPFDDVPGNLGADALVFDTIYSPPATKLIRQARSVGAKTIGGMEMFIRQAAVQFSAWTDLPAPLGVMRRVAEARLEAVARSLPS
jgi:3-dehydroquinate dehydratase/shikimate dehydrogenase